MKNKERNTNRKKNTNWTTPGKPLKTFKISRFFIIKVLSQASGLQNSLRWREINSKKHFRHFVKSYWSSSYSDIIMNRWTPPSKEDFPKCCFFKNFMSVLESGRYLLEKQIWLETNSFLSVSRFCFSERTGERTGGGITYFCCNFVKLL